MAQNWWDQLNSSTPAAQPATASQWWDSLAGNAAVPVAPATEHKQPRVISRFSAETGVVALETATKSFNALQDFASRYALPIAAVLGSSNPLARSLSVISQNDKSISTVVGVSHTPSSYVEKAFLSLTQNTAGKASAMATAEVEQLKTSPLVQPTPEYQNATLKQRLTTYLPETILHLGANVLGSWAPYIVSIPLGAGIQALAVADDIKKYARESGMNEGLSDVLALGTGVIVGLIDRIVPESLFGSSAVKHAFTKKIVTDLATTALKEGGTEVLQEDVQLIAESFVRNDITVDEKRERFIMSFLGGLFGGGVAHSIAASFNALTAQVHRENDTQSVDTSVPEQSTEGVVAPIEQAKKATVVNREPISRIFAENSDGKKDQTLMEKMRNKDKFQRGVDATTMEALNIGDPANPQVGSVFEVEGHLFIVRDVDTVNSDVIGYRVPLDGTPTVSLETKPLDSLMSIQASIEDIRSALGVSEIPSDVSRSSQFVTNEEAVKNINKYLRSGEDLNVTFQESISTPDGSKAFGAYADGIIRLINGPHETTVDHEVVHWYLDTQYSENEQQAVYEAARQQSGETNLDDAATEEWVADRFVRYVRERSGVTGVIRDFFERALSFARRVFKGTSPDAVTQLFEDIRTKKRGTGSRSLDALREQYYQKPEELTAKIFTLPEVSDRTVVGRTFITDMMKSGKANLKQAERLLLEDVLNTQFKDERKIDVQAFKKAVEAELLQLNIVNTRLFDIADYETIKYENVVLPESIRGEVTAYREHIYESPIETSAGKVHFGNEIENYFAHARIEDMADGSTRRVIELQSDLFQKKRLEQEDAQAREILGAGATDSEVGKFIFEQAKEREKAVKKLEQYSKTWWQRIIREEIRHAAVDGKKRILFPTGETAMKVEGLASNDRWSFGQRAAQLSDLVVGESLNDGRAYWVITEVLENGRFKAVPKTDNLFYRPVAGADELAPGLYGDSRNVETFDISGKVDTNNPIYRYYERDVVPYILKLKRGNARLMTDENGVSWVEMAVTQEDLAPVLAYQSADQIPEEDYQAWLASGAIPSPEANLDAMETVAAYEIERELGFVPKPNELPIGLAADLDYRRNLALNQIQQANLEEATAREQAEIILKEGLVFPDEHMETAYAKFKKEAKRKKWMLDPETDEKTIKMKFNKAGANVVDDLLFPSVMEGSMTNDEMLDQYRNRFMVEQELLETMKKKTSVEIMAEAKRLAERAVKDATIKKSERIKTTVININRRQKNRITLDEGIMLVNHIRDLAEGSAAGFKEGSRIMKDTMMMKIKQRETDRLATGNNIIEYLKVLPLEQRGKFNKAILKLKSQVNNKFALELMDQIDRIEEDFKKREAINEFKGELTKFKKGAPNIAIEYQGMIRDILTSFDGTKPTESTIKRLRATAQWMENNPSAYMPPSVVAKLKRLTLTPLADMTSSQIEEIVANVQRLKKQGRLKQMMENTNDEKIWQEKIDELKSNTVKREFVPTGNEKKDKAQKAWRALSDKSFSPMRVFDVMDGDNHYQGTNVMHARRLSNAEQSASIISDMRRVEAMELIKSAGVESLSEDSQIHISIYLALDQGDAGASVQTTMEKHGLEKLRALTEAETKVKEILQKAVVSRTDEIAALHVELTNTEFPELPRETYYPRKYDGERYQDATDAVIQDHLRRSSVEKGFTKERVPEVNKPLRIDLMTAFFETLHEQERYINIEPVIRDIASLVKSKEYAEFAGSDNAYYWSRHLDIVARGGTSADTGKDHQVDPWTRGKRYAISQAILGYKMSTFFLQYFNVFNTYAMVYQQHGFNAANLVLKEFMKSAINPRYAEAVVKESPSLTLRQSDMGDVTIQELSDRLQNMDEESGFDKAKKTFLRWSMAPMKFSDMQTAASANKALKTIFLNQGMNDSDAQSEADFYTDLVSSSAQVSHRPHIYADGQFMNLFLMFQSFSINQFGQVTHDIIKTGIIKGNPSEKMRAGLGITILLTGLMLTNMTRLGIYNLFKREEDEKEMPSVPAQLFTSIVSIVPLFGDVVNGATQGFQSGSLESPLFSTIDDLIKGGLNIGSGALDATFGGTEKKKKQGINRLKKNLFKTGKAALIWEGVPLFPGLLDKLKYYLVD